jgi:hypothetical protein
MKEEGTPEEKAQYADWIDDMCNNPEGTYTNSNLPKIPALASHMIEILCLIIMLAF